MGHCTVITFVTQGIEAQNQRQKEFITKTRNGENTKSFVFFRAFSFCGIRLEKRRVFVIVFLKAPYKMGSN